MSRISFTLLLMLLLFGAWSARLAFQHRHFNPGGMASSNPNSCPRYGFNPSRRLPGLRDITSISFVDSRLVAIDRQGNVWTYFRGESTCADPAPVKVLAADTAMKLYPQAGLPREAHRASILMNGQAIISLGLEFPDRCGTAGATCTPSKMAGLDKIVASASGDRHMLFARADGSLWSSGMNDCGQLGREGGEAYVEYFKRELRHRTRRADRSEQGRKPRLQQ